MWQHATTASMASHVQRHAVAAPSASCSTFFPSFLLCRIFLASPPPNALPPPSFLPSSSSSSSSSSLSLLLLLLSSIPPQCRNMSHSYGSSNPPLSFTPPVVANAPTPCTVLAIESRKMLDRYARDDGMVAQHCCGMPLWQSTYITGIAVVHGHTYMATTAAIGSLHMHKAFDAAVARRRMRMAAGTTSKVKERKRERGTMGGGLAREETPGKEREEETKEKEEEEEEERKEGRKRRWEARREERGGKEGGGSCQRCHPASSHVRDHQRCRHITARSR